MPVEPTVGRLHSIRRRVPGSRPTVGSTPRVGACRCAWRASGAPALSSGISLLLVHLERARRIRAA